jgi:hypothetical protein
MGLFIALGTVVLTAILSPFFLVMLRRASLRPPEIDPDGRTVLGLTMGLMVLGICSAAFCLSLIWLAVLLAMDPYPWDLGTAAVPVLGALLFIIIGWAIYGMFFIGVRFGADGILFRQITGSHLVPWEQVEQVVDHPIMGTYLRTSAGRLYLSKFRTGFQQLLAELRSRGVKGAERRSMVRPF